MFLWTRICILRLFMVSYSIACQNSATWMHYFFPILLTTLELSHSIRQYDDSDHFHFLNINMKQAKPRHSLLRPSLSLYLFLPLDEKRWDGGREREEEKWKDLHGILSVRPRSIFSNNNCNDLDLLFSYWSDILSMSCTLHYSDVIKHRMTSVPLSPHAYTIYRWSEQNKRYIDK